MDNLPLIIFVIFVFLFIYAVCRKVVVVRQSRAIDVFSFPDSLPLKIQKKYPHLRADELELVIKGLREYFHVCNLAGRRMVSMPSQVVDIAWHEFILFTRKYEQFCKTAFGRFLHHTPAEAMSSPTLAQKGIKTAWRISCHRERIIPRSPHKLPLLFAIDSTLKIPDGFKYSLNCSASKNTDYCASHIGCGSGCGGGCGGDSGCGGGGD